MTSTATISHQVLLGCVPDTARRAWTEQLGDWWPVATHSVLGEAALVEVADGLITESLPGGPSGEWGRISEDTDGELHVSWRAGVGPSEATWFWLSFVPTPLPDTCLVRLVHGGWERRAPQMRQQYRDGWPVVLAALAEHAGAPSSDGELWLLVTHTPGPAFDSIDLERPDGHTGAPAFLERLDRPGLVVAAGPLSDAPEVAVSALRCGSFAEAAAAVQAAHLEDETVLSELRQVRVRPWHVVLPG